MKKNVGLPDAMLRLVLGFFLWGKSIQHHHNLLLLLSALEIASGITRFCPTYHLLNLSTYPSNCPLTLKRLLKS